MLFRASQPGFNSLLPAILLFALVLQAASTSILQLRYDAMAISGVSDGAAISSWNENSGNNRKALQHGGVNGAGTVTYQLAGINGHPSLAVFGNTALGNAMLEYPGGVDANFLRQTVVMVFRLDLCNCDATCGLAAHYLFDFRGDGWNAFVYGAWTDPGNGEFVNGRRWINGEFVPISGSQCGILSSAPVVLVWEARSGHVGDEMKIFSNSGGAENVNAQISELHVYDSVLLDDQRVQVECDLGAKWGITIAGCPSNYVTYNGTDYATLDFADPDFKPITWVEGHSNCQQDLLPLPDGWTIAADNADSFEVATTHYWSTNAITYGVLPGFGISTGGHDGYPAGQRESGWQFHQVDDTYKPRHCHLRILISRTSVNTTFCGDSNLDADEECDDGNDDNTDDCLNTCVAATCGDGYVQAEAGACDDGNDDSTDACLNTCVAATCGDGFVQAEAEACDDGNNNNTDACLNNCVAATCGDGFVQAGVEVCDDGNNVDFDGCGGACTHEDCDETEAMTCHVLAYCQASTFTTTCQCPEGTIGDGVSKCDTEGWTVRTLYKSCEAPTSETFQGGAEAVVVIFDADSKMLEVNQLYNYKDGEPTAGTPTAITVGNSTCTPWDFGSRVYTWSAGTSSSEARILPSGLTVDAVSFSSTCTDTPDDSAGCWMIEVTYTTGGPEAFNAFYFPHMNGDDTQSYDFNYPAAATGTFDVSKFPVTAPNGRTDEIDEFYTTYRPTDNFKTWAVNEITDTSAAKTIERPDNPEDAAFDIAFPSSPKDFLAGTFKDLKRSPGVVTTTLLDPFFYQYEATIEIDELDLRQLAGVMKGTAGVEYTVDSFLGFVNFRPTGILSLDTMATQTALHIEKTNFFTVSTHGTNDYTFLEYVNLRLVSVLLQDTDTSDETAGETGDNEIFTNGTNSAVYVQVTFTLGPQYRPNENEGLVPLTSVSTGKGTFFSAVDGSMDHSCAQWAKNAAASGTRAQDFVTHASYPAFSNYTGFRLQTTFESRLAQSCASGANMCKGPLVADHLSDQFVSFNIPLGMDYLGVDQSNAAGDLSMNVFVDMVISAVDKTLSVLSGTPNDGAAAQQMKTTLTASIPVVEGGVNLFCDGVTAKTDLKDVAKVTLIIGSAKDSNELSRLTIFADIANTAMDPQDASAINTDSIEASIMTLVIEGTEEFFTHSSGTSAYSLELEDVITVHIMDPSESSTGTTFIAVKDLLTTAGDDNDQGSGIDTNGYALNGAFDFTIDRVHNRAHLEPSTALLLLCPFNPTRPVGAGTSCVTRRDVRYRDFPARVGGVSTAMEITPTSSEGTGTDSDYEEEARFMQTVLGGNDYAADLGRSYADVISTKYLQGTGADRYNRAWWINPGYEWTPTQTGGNSIFSLSQQIVMFALINLNENYNNAGGNSITGDSLTLPEGAGSTFRRRRMLLSTVDQDQGTTAMSLEFNVSPRALMASALNVPEDRINLFEVLVSLTQAEACMDIESLSDSLAKTFDDYLTNTASLYEEVLVVSINKDMGNEDCSSRRRLKTSFSSATANVQMLIAFTEGTVAKFNIEAFAELPGIESVAPNGEVSKIDFENTFTTSKEEKQQQTKELDSPGAEGGDNSMVIIAAACGSVGALLLVGVAIFFYKRSQEAYIVETVAINVHDLKAQLANDV